MHEQHVAQRLGHLFVINGQEPVVHPVARKIGAVMSATTLRELILVMRKDQVLATSVNINRLAEVLLGHRRAFDVPAGPALAPRRIPARQFGRRGFPQDEVLGRPLVGRNFDARPGDHLAKITLR